MSLRIRAAALGALATAAVLASMGPPDVSAKFDRALRDWAHRPSTRTVRALIHVRPGAAPVVRVRLARRPGAEIVGSASADLLVAELSSKALLDTARDSDVTRISSDALVHSLGTSSLTNDVLLNTEALLPRTYTGAGVGIAVIDSGILPNANLKVTATYDFVTKNGAKISALDPYGHGTHVTGLIASNGTTSNDLYESVAPGVKLFAFRALDQNGPDTPAMSSTRSISPWSNKSKLALTSSICRSAIRSTNRRRAIRSCRPSRTRSGLVSWSSPLQGISAGIPHSDTGYGGSHRPGMRPTRSPLERSKRTHNMARSDDTVAWYSSRGPTWYDAFQKPDWLRLDRKLVSDVRVQHDREDLSGRSHQDEWHDQAHEVSAEPAWPQASITGVVRIDARSEPDNTSRREADAQRPQGNPRVHRVSDDRQLRPADAGCRRAQRRGRRRVGSGDRSKSTCRHLVVGSRREHRGPASGPTHSRGANASCGAIASSGAIRSTTTIRRGHFAWSGAIGSSGATVSSGEQHRLGRQPDGVGLARRLGQQPDRRDLWQ